MSTGSPEPFVINNYFSLYSKELQEKRIKFKPGLLPPFYADMPQSMDEIQASEMKYLISCEIHGEFKTDMKYFLVILKNILVKKARSGWEEGVRGEERVGSR